MAVRQNCRGRHAARAARTCSRRHLIVLQPRQVQNQDTVRRAHRTGGQQSPPRRRLATTSGLPAQLLQPQLMCVTDPAPPAACRGSQRTASVRRCDGTHRALARGARGLECLLSSVQRLRRRVHGAERALDGAPHAAPQPAAPGVQASGCATDAATQSSARLPKLKSLSETARHFIKLRRALG